MAPCVVTGVHGDGKLAATVDGDTWCLPAVECQVVGVLRDPASSLEAAARVIISGGRHVGSLGVVSLADSQEPSSSIRIGEDIWRIEKQFLNVIQ